MNRPPMSNVVPLPAAVPTTLRLTGRQRAALAAHLFPGDGCEAVAFVLCGRRRGAPREVLVGHEVRPVPHEACPVRTPTRVEWPTSELAAALERAAAEGLALVKVHSHPTGHRAFSSFDDASDRSAFRFVHGWLGETQGDAPHASAVMLPDGALIARTVGVDGSFRAIGRVAVVGDDLDVYDLDADAAEVSGATFPAFALRHVQAFGRGTFERLRRLSVAVVGCSGTGSPVVEQLARYGVGEVVLVDPDRVEPKNRNRIANAFEADDDRHKVDVLADAVRRMGTGTRPVPLAASLSDPTVVRRVAACDVAFGCVDSLEGRHVLNRLCAHYGLLYIDVGVGLATDGAGGVRRAASAVHVLQPDGSSLLSRGVYTAGALAAEALRAADPEAYAEMREADYIAGAPPEETPAVVTLNTIAASVAVHELLARLHPYRLDPNAEFARWQINFASGMFAPSAEGEPCPEVSPLAGLGDTSPPLGLPALSVRRAA